MKKEILYISINQHFEVHKIACSHSRCTLPQILLDTLQGDY
jgi:hypothetical protein